MGINKGEHFKHQDIYIDYDFEEVMFRWDHVAKRIYRKFYGKEEDTDPISHDNRLFNDSLLMGEKITEEEYLKGKPKGSG